MFEVARWITSQGRAAADQIAGEEMPSAWAWSTGKDGDEEKQGMKLVPDLLDPAAQIVAPYFNVVSDQSKVPARDTRFEMTDIPCLCFFLSNLGGRW
jgi:hypothetical protein